MNVLVTGGAGYIGSHTVKELIKKGISVTVLDNLSRGHKQAILSEHFIQMDLENKDSLSQFLKTNRFDAVIHFAAFAYVGESMKDPLLYYRNNVINTINLLTAMHENDIDKIVFSSSCSTYGENPGSTLISESTDQNPINTYARTKLMDEQIIMDLSERLGLKYCLLRYFNAAGSDPEGRLGEDHDPEPHLIPLVLRAALNGSTIKIFGSDYPTPDGTCIRDYTHVTDLARAHVLGLEYMDKGNGIFNLGTGIGHSNLEVIDTCEKVTGKKISYEMTARRPGDPAVLIADPQKAKSLLRWNVAYPAIEDMIVSSWKWMLKNPNGYNSL